MKELDRYLLFIGNVLVCVLNLSIYFCVDSFSGSIRIISLFFGVTNFVAAVWVMFYD